MLPRSSASPAGIAASAPAPRACMARAIGSGDASSLNTPFSARRRFDTPSSASSPRVRSASRSAAVSGRLTSTTVVCAGSDKRCTVAAYNAFCFSSPASGPRQEAPPVESAMNSLHADGSVSRRSVWPVGAVSKITWSNSAVLSGYPSSLENSSNAAISTVHAPENCSSMLAMAAGGRIPRYGATMRSR